MIESIRIETKDVKVGRRSFSFDYRVYRNGRRVYADQDIEVWDHYDSAHSRSHNTMRKLLLDGYATELVLQGLF